MGPGYRRNLLKRFHACWVTPGFDKCMFCRNHLATCFFNESHI
ncbi:hypothetical protein D3OALGA1CA_1164 [Olavius algarvensis associated proteobacterium Delta 3]|nr:hypothetical protein D3OALGA1CA_1164 [Olavius algarvensis associated proteobacterium Delta 3]